MEHILLPTELAVESTDNPNIGKLVISPFQQGYGTTVGNALRRVLLSSLPGAAVESVRIDGVSHEFGAVEGVQEDMVEIILNFKQVALKLHSDGPVVLKLSKKGKKGPVTMADFDKNADVEIINPDLVLMTLTTDRALEVEIIVGKGRGYVSAAEKETKNLDLGTVVIDSLYTPIRDVGYAVENTRVGDVTDYEKLTMTIETNGTISPKEAVNQATKILMDHFAVMLDVPSTAPGTAADEANEAEPEEVETEEQEEAEDAAE